MNKVIAAYIYMRHYQRLQEQEDSSFIRNMVTCYATMTQFYSQQFMTHPPASFTMFEYLTAQDMNQISYLTLDDLRSHTPRNGTSIDLLTSVTDPDAASLYHSIPEMKQLHPGLEKLLIITAVKPKSSMRDLKNDYD